MTVRLGLGISEDGRIQEIVIEPSSMTYIAAAACFEQAARYLRGETIENGTMRAKIDDATVVLAVYPETE